jgi:hypothetical protein
MSSRSNGSLWRNGSDSRHPGRRSTRSSRAQTCIVKRQTFEIRRKLPNQRQALGWLGATACAEVKFRLDDGAQQDVLAPDSGEACGDTRLTPAQKFNADV